MSELNVATVVYVTESNAVLTIERDESIAIVRLNRPDALNAANDELHRRLAEVWLELAREPDLGAVVLTGNGRAFCAGGDMGVLDRMNRDTAYRDATLREARQIVERLVQFPVPIVAAVNGPAVGLGCSLAGLSDIVLMEESAYMADPHVSVGLVAADGGALTWPAMMSLLKAKEYLYTGDRIPAAVAVELGIANRVVADGTSVAEATARSPSASPPSRARRSKRPRRR